QVDAFMRRTSETSLFYKASDIHYQIVGNGHLSVKKVGEKNGVPVYRNLKQEGTTIRLSGEAPFVLTTVGSYEIGKKENQLASNPLGIYGLTPAKLLSNGKVVHATIYPGSFVSAPAHGVTTMKAAQIIKGDKPIDAIRVRVAGIHGYTKEAAEKIKSVAGQIAEMGLAVDVVAGASNQLMKVDVEGIGTVLEPWTTLGASASIVKAWNGTTFLLWLAFAIVALFYILGRVMYWNVSREGEADTLFALGWPRNLIRRKLKAEMTVLCLVASIFAFIAIRVYQQVSNTESPVFLWLFIGIGLYLVLMWTLLSSRLGTKEKGGRVPKISLHTGEKSHLIRRNVMYYRSFIFIPFIQLVLVSALAAFVYLSLGSTVSQTNLTVLGQYINLQGQTINQILAGIAILIAVMTTIESTLALYEKRTDEITLFSQVGWNKRDIFGVLLGETAFWSGISILIGGLISFLVVGMFFTFTLHSIIISGLIFLALFLIILAVSSMVIYRTVS
ncbi:MAG TPA: ABC transporter permease, partial [Bacillales bacterium]|nr:ABC transporter permease [Bacillales bacterium]